MNTRYLHYILTIAEERSFSKAASRLFISQPSLSQYIKKLEKELGIELFDRNKSSFVELTYAGKLYIKTALEIQNLEKELSQQILDIIDYKRGYLSICASNYRTTYLLPPALAMFKKQYPKIEISLIQKINLELEELILKGDLDLALTVLSDSRHNFNWEVVMIENFLLAVPAENPNETISLPFDINNLETVELKQYKDMPFIMQTPDQLSYKQIKILINKSGFEPNIIFECKNLDAVHAMVIQGLGVCILTDTMIKNGNFLKHPRYYRIKDMPAQREIAIIWKKDRYLSKPASVFISMLKHI